MEGLDDDDFSDLYADVEVQASSAISALHRSTEIPPSDGTISANAARGEKKAANSLGGPEIEGGNRKFHERDAAGEEAEEKKGGGGGLRDLPVANGVTCGTRNASEGESGSGSGSGSESGGNERKGGEDCDSETYDDRASDVELGEIVEKEKSGNGGDYSSERKNLQYSSPNSKKTRADDMAQVHRPCKRGDADDRDPFSSRACQDSHPNYGQKLERHTQASYPVPSDLDKCGSVHISDSEEDSPHEMSECDSESISETSDDTNRRKASSMSNKVSSALEPESTKSGRSQDGRGYSCSPSRAARSSRYIEKGHNRSRYSSSSLRCEIREPMTCKYRSPKDSDSRGIKRGTGDGPDGGYSERWRNNIREPSNQPKKFNYIPYFKSRPDEDASYGIDAKNLHNRYVNHGKQRAMVTFNYNESDIPNYNHPERILTYSGGRLPDHHLGQTFLKDQFWDLPHYRYKKSGHLDGHSMSERQNFIDKRSSQMDPEALECNWFQNQRIHPFQCDIESVAKYSSIVDRRGSQYKGEDIHPMRRTRQEYLSPLLDCDGRFVERKYGRIHPNNGGDRDHLNCRLDRNIAHDRREVESSGRGKRRRHSPLNSSDSIRFIETKVNDRRNIRHRPFPFYSSEEPNSSGRGEFVGGLGPKSGVTQRNTRCSWKETRIECDQYGPDHATFVSRESLRYHPPKDYLVKRRDHQQSLNTCVTRESIKDDQYQDHFVRRRRHQHSEVVHLREDKNKSMQQDDSVFSSGVPHFKRITKNDEADDKPSFCRVTELNERETGRQKSHMLKEEDYNNNFDECRKSTQLQSHAQMHPSHQDSVDSLVVVDRKCSLQSSIRRITEAGEDTYYGRRDLVGWNDNEEPNNFEDRDDFNPDPVKTAYTNDGKLNASLSNRNQQSKFSKNQQNMSLDIEEGQIVTEKVQYTKKCMRASEDSSQMNAKGHPEAASNGNRVVEGLDDEKIREIMMKMERRRERFKEMIPMSQDCDKTSCPLPDSNVGIAEARLERPARKRRWLGT